MDISNKGKDRRIGKDALGQDSTLFSTSLANGDVGVVLMDDQGSDTNLMPPSLFQHVDMAGAAFRVTHLDPPH